MFEEIKDIKWRKPNFQPTVIFLFNGIIILLCTLLMCGFLTWEIPDSNHYNTHVQNIGTSQPWRSLLALDWMFVYLVFSVIWDFSFRFLCSIFIALPFLYSCLLFDYTIVYFPYKFHHFYSFHVVHISIFKLRSGISGFFLIKHCLFCLFFLLPFLFHLWFPVVYFQQQWRENISMQLKNPPLVYGNLIFHSVLILKMCHLLYVISWFLNLLDKQE